VEIYVRPFPNVDGGRWTVSTNGGRSPAWARDGQELFYVDRTGALMRVPVETSPTFKAGAPSKLLDAKYFTGGTASVNGRTYDVSADGQRFLMIKDVPAADRPVPSMVVVLNWRNELEARLAK
jgi:hypothetical protein